MAQDANTQREAADRAPGPAAAEDRASPPKLPLPPRDTADDLPPTPNGGLGALKPSKTGGNTNTTNTNKSGGWLAVGALLVWAMAASDVAPAGGSFFASPMMVVAAATICLPIALFWFL